MNLAQLKGFQRVLSCRYGRKMEYLPADTLRYSYVVLH
jgi:hypothetical protein